jgi:mono/diheme cytochrome c family protein
LTVTYLLTSCNNVGNKSNGNSVEPVSGELLYQKYCAACHGDKGQKRPAGAINLIDSRIEDDAIRQVILYGNNKGMGPYKSMIKNEVSLKQLIKHVKTLRKN